MTHISRAEAHHNRGAMLLANEEYKKALIELKQSNKHRPSGSQFQAYKSVGIVAIAPDRSSNR